MSEPGCSVSISIDRTLSDLPSSPFRPSIFRIDNYLKSVNENLHDPKLVSIGPLHHGKNHLRKMEQHKWRYLKLLLQRLNESGVEKYVEAIRSLEEQARGCYADPVDLSSDEFVKMLLLDGFFIIELIRRYKFVRLRERDDPIFKNYHILCQLVHDLMLLENQVPFFVLHQLFTMTNIENPPDNLISLIQLLVGDAYTWPGGDLEAPGEVVSEENVDHLVDLMYKTWYSSFGEMATSIKGTNMLDINSATELLEAGIEFEKDATSHLLGIRFVNGVITIPTFVVSDAGESTLRNLILYEYIFNNNIRPKYVTDYIFFMQCLINSSKDVEILRLRGIMSNPLGDDDMMHRMLKRLGRNVYVSHIFCYGDVLDRVNAHCRLRRNRWMANLRHNYFNSPWAFISVVAAAFLLILTSIQTVFSIL